MNRKIQSLRLNAAIKNLQTAKKLIYRKQLKKAKNQIHDAVFSCGSFVNKSVKSKRKSN